jgi:general secretion pathway protein H
MIRRGIRGMTLLELLIVLVLLGIMAAVTIPILGSGVSTTELRSAARQVAAGLRTARTQAITQRSESVLVLDVAARAFSVPPDARVHSINPGIGLKLYTAAHDIVNENVGAIRFYPDGGSTGGRVTLTAGERKYDVDVDWLTGRVAILE